VKKRGDGDAAMPLMKRVGGIQDRPGDVMMPVAADENPDTVTRLFGG
jgi:hypothetical protein